MSVSKALKRLMAFQASNSNVDIWYIGIQQHQTHLRHLARQMSMSASTMQPYHCRNSLIMSSTAEWITGRLGQTTKGQGLLA